MKQVVVDGGVVKVIDVPPPTVGRGQLLIRTAWSAISPGTEAAGRASGGRSGSLAARAVRNPDLVRKVVDRARAQGVRETVDLVRSRLATSVAVGYSASGTVVEIGDGVSGFAVGDRVACAGAGYANHAEYIVVPERLVAHVPEGVPLEHACFATIGSIAMHGVRQLAPQLGEVVVVLGLGIVGQLCVQLAAASGCLVVAADPVRDRMERASRARSTVGPEHLAEEVARVSRGYGADGVLLTAATRSSDPVNEAFTYCRDRARVVVVGDIGMDLRRQEMYLREIEVRISRSYGPGRYDPSYEEEGNDYPIGYVRWTEQRNLACFLGLLADGSLPIESLIDMRAPVEDAPSVYERLDSDRRILGAIIEYPGAPLMSEDRSLAVTEREVTSGSIGIGVIGAGTFARSVHLPNLRDSHGIDLVAASSRTGAAAARVARSFGIASCTTDPREVVRDPRVRAVIIASRHHEHAQQVLDALACGKDVFVEKPLALSVEDCLRVEKAVGTRIVAVGFNRRFAPAYVLMREAVGRMHGPKHVSLRVNAGRLPPDHWTYGRQGGGRVAGEGCHFFDLLRWMIRSEPVDVRAAHTTGSLVEVEDLDNLSAVLTFEDGSVASLSYATSGNDQTGKERVEVFGAGASILFDDYRRVTIEGINGMRSARYGRIEKGHRQLMTAFLDAVRGMGPAPTSARDGTVAQACAEACMLSARTGQAIKLADILQS